MSMAYGLLCLSVFFFAYLLNIFYVSVLYHRGLTHGAVILKPWFRTFVVHSGNWITGIDPKAWSCMHRMHHRYSDTAKDPHSPSHKGVFYVMAEQLYSYNKVLRNLILGREQYVSAVRDLDFPVNWLNRKSLWYLPYVFHAVVSLAVALPFEAPMLALAYWFGIMSHPIQGWLVNSFGHHSGYRNFETPDKSRNNTAVAWLVMGEGYQNNHHQDPRSAKFSVKWWEVDLGYALCLLAQGLGLLTIREKHAETTIDDMFVVDQLNPGYNPQ